MTRSGRSRINRDRTLQDLIDQRRYLDWAYFAASDHKLANPEFREEVLGEARSILRLVRARLEIVVKRLSDRGYQFEYPERVLSPPIADATQWVREMDRYGLRLPVIFQAWIEEVGSVNLNGQDPSWPAISVAAIDDSDELYVDPLQVEMDLDYLASELDSWRYNCEEYGAEDVGPFEICFSADAITKANFSGGHEYALDAGRPAVDPVVLYEVHCLRFLPYVLTSLSYGGFIGFDQVSCPKHQFVVELLAGLT